MDILQQANAALGSIGQKGTAMKTKYGLLFGFAVMLIAAIFFLTGCPTEAEDDGGSSPKTATALTAGQLINGEITKGKNSKGEEIIETADWFKFEATSDRWYKIFFDNTTRSEYTIRLSVYKSDASTPLYNGWDDIGLLGLWSWWGSFGGDYTGTVYIKVYPRGSATGSYTVKYEVYDSDNTREVATALAAGRWTRAEINPEGDVDWYSFEATSDKTYTLTWDELGGSGSETCNIKVSAFGSDGRTAFSNFVDVNSGPKTISNYSGRVYIKVGSAASNSTGTYAIKYDEQ
jgi:hypothetical protein